MRVRSVLLVGGLASVTALGAAQAQQPTSILPPGMASPAPAPAPATPPVQPTIVPPVVVPTIAPAWSLANARALLAAIEVAGKSGLIAADYEPDVLRAAIAAGEGVPLNDLATRLFKQLGGDLRDGRTPAAARVQWLIKDSDATAMPLDTVLGDALARQDIAGALLSLEPLHPEYAALKAELARTPAANATRIRLIQTNMDRWRWLPRSLGQKHVIANVPEFILRVNTFGKNIATYRVIVGKKNTATPQLATPATGIVVHPPWVLPRSIIKEEVGPLIARSPAAARARGYTWTGSGNTLSVVQQPGPTAALGLLKIDMPNAEAIFIHDTPNRNLFGNYPRAYSHGCLRTEKAFELGILLGILQSGASPGDELAREAIAEELVTKIKAGKTEKIPFKEPIPVFIGYFTIGTGTDGKLQSFPDLYGRDAPVIAAFGKPRAVLLAPPSKPVGENKTAGT
jgi:L,D-transpeptidase YcbB